jgi:FkbM family methyltransferase
MKEKLKIYLQKKGWYYRLKYSSLFRIYQAMFKPEVFNEHRRELNFYKSFLQPCSLIFDIGANDGHKTAAFLELADKVVACEPDTESFSILQQRFRHQHLRIKLINEAVSEEVGTAIIHQHHPGSAFNTLSDKWAGLLEKQGEQRWSEKIRFPTRHKVPTTTLDKLIEENGLPGFIKIDTEGFEENVLKGLSQPVPFISFETLLPEYAGELASCLTRIEAISAHPVFNIAMHEKLLLPGYVTRLELQGWLQQNPQSQSFEVIAKCV